MLISLIFLKGKNLMFGLRYARSAFIEAIFFFGVIASVKMTLVGGMKVHP
jgi:hypothetical protein